VWLVMYLGNHKGGQLSVQVLGWLRELKLCSNYINHCIVAKLLI
jgi:hypothetical protein